jgi:hypothetical protein
MEGERCIYILGCSFPHFFFVLHRGLQIGVPNNAKLPCIFYFTRKKKYFGFPPRENVKKKTVFRDFFRKFTVPLRKKITGFRGMIDIVLIYDIEKLEMVKALAVFEQRRLFHFFYFLEFRKIIKI